MKRINKVIASCHRHLLPEVLYSYWSFSELQLGYLHNLHLQVPQAMVVFIKYDSIHATELYTYIIPGSLIPFPIPIPMVLFVILISAQGFSSIYFYSLTMWFLILIPVLLKMNDYYSKSHSNKPNFDYVSNSATWSLLLSLFGLLIFTQIIKPLRVNIISDTLYLKVLYRKHKSFKHI